MFSLQHSILSTLAYHSIFDYPLTLNEIHRYLISEKTVSPKETERAINNLSKTKKVHFRNGFFLPLAFSPWPLALINLRQRRKETNQKKLIIAKRASRVISIIPWVKMIVVTGALAMENADEDDDIDLMIVTSNNCLWIVRPLAMILISIFFKRRKPLQQFNPAERDPALQDNLTIKQFNNSLCLNLWLDESSLEIPLDQRNLYTAHELAQMKPIINRDETYEKMMAENIWGKEYLANAWKRFKGWQVGRLKKLNNFNLLNLLNLLAFNLQFQFMKSKMTNERVSLHFAFFHPGNRTDTILDRYDRLCHRNL